MSGVLRGEHVLMIPERYLICYCVSSPVHPPPETTTTLQPLTALLGVKLTQVMSSRVKKLNSVIYQNMLNLEHYFPPFNSI